MYYLQSRYYDPAIGRFLNSDEPLLLEICGSNLSCNLIAYCENNTVNFKDPSGYGPVGTIIGLILGYGLGLFLLPYMADILKFKGWKRRVFILLGLAAFSALGAYIGNYVGEVIFSIYQAGGALAHQINKLIAYGIASLFGSVLNPAKGDGLKIKIGNLLLRIMTSGGGRFNYFKLSMDGKGALTLAGDLSNDLSLIHIPITIESIVKIVRLIKKLLGR